MVSFYIVVICHFIAQGTKKKTRSSKNDRLKLNVRFSVRKAGFLLRLISVFRRWIICI